MTELFGAPLHINTRAQAIADGALKEVPEELSRNAGIAVPVVLTATVWENCVRWDDDDAKRTGVHFQDETGRMWDVLWMGWLAARHARPTDSTPVPFGVHRIARDAEPGPDGAEPTHVRLLIALSQDPDGTPYVTIMDPIDN
ncbi:DUF6573 family protein [Actinomadura geliboluensis]|uniref:DUF6573 family protein n=1 Tax=Actinomadura geliboluensis TaxID=882440 RepID=UPI003724B446